MRCVTLIAAVQLRSVAQRYRQQTVRQTFGSPTNRWLVWPAKQPEMADGDPSEDLQRRQRVEAVLLLAREPLSSRRLAQFARLADGTEARTLVRRLNHVYDQTGRAFRVEEVAGGFRMLTRRQFAPWLRRLEHLPSETRLSAPAMETLAVVAYRQPVLRAEIEAIRGVGCGEILRQLMDRDLVRISGRSDDLGRPYLYTTTRRFLQLFGLQDLEQLPRVELIRSETDNLADEPEPSMQQPLNDQALEEKTDVTTTSIIPEATNGTLDPDVPVEAGMNFDTDDIDDLDFDEEEDDDDIDWDDDLDDDLEDDDDEEDDYDESEWEEVEDDEDEDWDEEDDDDWGDDDDDDDEEEDEGEDEENGKVT